MQGCRLHKFGRRPWHRVWSCCECMEDRRSQEDNSTAASMRGGIRRGRHSMVKDAFSPSMPVLTVTLSQGWRPQRQPTCFQFFVEPSEPDATSPHPGTQNEKKTFFRGQQKELLARLGVWAAECNAREPGESLAGACQVDGTTTIVSKNYPAFILLNCDGQGRGRIANSPTGLKVSLYWMVDTGHLKMEGG